MTWATRTWRRLRGGGDGIPALRALAVGTAVLAAAASWTAPAVAAAGQLHIAHVAPAAAATANALLCIAAWYRAQGTTEERWLWQGILWNAAILSPCVLLRAAATADAGPTQLLVLSLAATVLIVTGCLAQHAGVNAWHQGDSDAQRDNPAGSDASSARARAVDRHEVLLGLAAVAITLGLLNAAALLLTPPPLPGAALGQGWVTWATAQPPLALMATAAVRTQALLTVAHARKVLGDLRMWLLATSAIITAAACAGDVLTTDLTWQAAAAPVALVIMVLAALLPPTRRSYRPQTSQAAATVGSFAVLLVAMTVLAAGATGHTLADEAAEIPAALIPFAASAVVLAVLAAALTSTRLLLNLRHLVWSMTFQREALTDELTGLLNRRGLLQNLERACAGGGPLGLAVIDVDHFKSVNDSLGHAAGDELLRQVSQRLQSTARTFTYQRTIARLGGDEFAVLVQPREEDTPDEVRADSAAKARAWGELLQQLFAEPFDLAGSQVHLTASIALTTVNPSRASTVPRTAWGATPPAITAGERRPSELLRRVDAAMIEAKAEEQRGLAVIYDPARHDDASRRLRTVEDLRRGIEAGELTVHYQPQVNEAGRTVGLEALVRWQHPSQGLLGPAAFLGLAESHGLMGKLTDEVLGQVFAQMARWRSCLHPGMSVGLNTGTSADISTSLNTGMNTVDGSGSTASTAPEHVAGGLTVSVNLSATSLLDARLPQRVAELLHQYGVPAQQVVLEVTETVLLRDPERSSAVVSALRELGVELSIDDFGTGYSSLTQLRSLPVHELKLDRAFTSGLDSDDKAHHIVASTVALAHGLGLRVVAEGVEDPATLTLLHRLGCNLTQGYLHARPLPSAQLLAWLHRQVSAPVPPSSITSGAHPAMHDHPPLNPPLAATHARGTAP